MKLSLSVRIAESLSKTELFVPFEKIISIAAEAGYDAVCIRASAGGVETSRDALKQMRDSVEQAGLRVSMVTADFEVPLNNEHGPESLRNIGPSLDVAELLDCDLVRVCLKKRADIPHAQAAADQAADRGVRLAHQCHTSSLFEEVQPMLEVLHEIDRSNFGLIYEPANLLVCGQAYDESTLRALKPFLMNAYVQNHLLDPSGPDRLNTYCRGEVRFHHLDLWEEGGVDFNRVFSGLQAIQYDGYFTIHQAQGIENVEGAKHFAQRCAEWIQQTDKNFL